MRLSDVNGMHICLPRTRIPMIPFPMPLMTPVESLGAIMKNDDQVSSPPDTRTYFMLAS